jgi:hypothetical protein
MTDNKIYLPEVLVPEDPNSDVINDLSNPGQTINVFLGKGTEKGNQKIAIDPRFPDLYIAREVISKALDTSSQRILGSFNFGETGALQVGKYELGVSGDLRISPNGLSARNSAGDTTFAIDGTTGDATFLGTVAAGSIITGYLAVGEAAGDVNSGATTISGGKITANSITADRLSVSTLSAITADLGTITAGTVTGAVIQTSTGSSRWELTASPQRMRMLDSGNERVVMQADGMQMYGNTALRFRETSGSTDRGVIGATSTSFLVNTSAVDTMSLSNTKSGGDVHVTADDSVRIYCSNFEINGASKSAIVPYKEKYLALYCTEAPEVWFFDFAPDINSVDQKFWDVTEGYHKTLTTDQGEIMVFRRRKGFGNVRFEEKTKVDFDRNNNLWSPHG